MIKPQKLKPCACIITHGNPSFAVCTEFERGFPEPMETPLPTPLQNTSTVPSLIQTSCMRLLGILGPSNDCSIKVFLLEVCVLLEYLNVVMHGLQLSKLFSYLNTSRSQ